MSELKATPGPWHKTDGAGIYTGVIRNGKLYRGKQVCRAPLKARHKPSVVAENWENNASLLSASHDMYEVLDAIFKAIESGFDGNDVLDVNSPIYHKLFFALAKARGES